VVVLIGFRKSVLTVTILPSVTVFPSFAIFGISAIAITFVVIALVFKKTIGFVPEISPVRE
jgi:hypothetical protein